MPSKRRTPAAWSAAAALLLAAILAPTPSPAQVQLPIGFEDQFVVGDLDRSFALAFLPDGRLLVAERTGRCRFIVDGKFGAVDPVLSVDSLGISSDEEGLLGITVDKQWPVRPYVYTFSTAVDSTIRISRWRAHGSLSSSTSVDLWIDPSSRLEILRDIPNKKLVHNGGTLRFGPDGYLYVGLGDDDYRCAAQDTSTLRGVLLRLKVNELPDGPGPVTDKNLLVAPGNPFASHRFVNARLVWSLGLRNPVRFHVDPAGTGVYLADQGFFQYEEISLANTPGEDFGWPYFEGPTPAYGPCFGTIPSPLDDPVFAYDRSELPQASVISAGVYRPGGCCSFPASYNGDYFFSDYYGGFLRRIEVQGGVWNYAVPEPGQPTSIDWGLGFEEVSDYTVGPDGALWYCRQSTDGQPMSGSVHRIVHTGQSVTGVTPATEPGVSFAPPAPSPARGATRFSYTLEREAAVRLTIFDALGRRVRELAPLSRVAAGPHTVAWDGTTEDGAPARAGIYVARLTVNGVAHEHRLPLLR